MSAKWEFAWCYWHKEYGFVYDTLDETKDGAEYKMIVNFTTAYSKKCNLMRVKIEQNTKFKESPNE